MIIGVISRTSFHSRKKFVIFLFTILAVCHFANQSVLVGLQITTFLKLVFFAAIDCSWDYT